MKMNATSKNIIPPVKIDITPNPSTKNPPIAMPWRFHHLKRFKKT